MNVDSILAIDGATKTGWAFLDVDGSICSGHVDFSADCHGMVFNAYRRWLDKTLSELMPAVVAYEVPQIGKANRVSSNIARLMLGGLYGQTVAELRHRDIACHQISPAEVKKSVTGRGNAAKADVMAAVRARGFDVANHDEADAVAILLASMASFGDEFLTSSQDTVG